MKPVRRWRATAPTSVGLILTLALMLSLLGSAAGSAAPAASAAEVGLSFTVDPDLQPAQSTLGPAREGDPPRQLASVADAYGNQADFVADELVLVSDDAAAVDAFAARWGGEMLVTFDPAEYGLPELRPQYLVRIDPNRADSARLEADLSEANPEARGAHRVSSPDGLALLAVAARETNRGLRVGVNWVVRFEEVRNRTSIEDPVAPFPLTSRNAFTWPHLCDAASIANCPQDTGVAEAWRLLALRKVLPTDEFTDSTVGFPADARIPVAILDGGFRPFDADAPPGRVQFSPGPNPGACGGAPCPSHGTNTTSAAMAVADNAFGAAGPGAFVARPVQIGILGDVFGGVRALLGAPDDGIRIVNMSIGLALPASVGLFTGFADSALETLRNRGVMLVASAGNNGRPVDMVDGFWEAAYFWPCEAPKVFCVGALDLASKTAAAFSNFRGPLHNTNPDETVDLWAPGTVLVGPDPENPTPRLVSGTSFASPFVAGVAAMMIAGARHSGSSLTPDQIEKILLDTAQQTNPHPVTGAAEPSIDAYRAVRAALGPATPVANAGPDQTVDELAQFTLDGNASTDRDGAALSYSWNQVGGNPATFSSAAGAKATFAAPSVSGTQTLAFELTVWNGARWSAPDTVTITVRDLNSRRTAPVVTVPSSLQAWTWNPEGDFVNFSASARDAEDGPLPVTCSPASASFFPTGTTTVTCWATDSDGDTGSASFEVSLDPRDPPK